MQTTIEGAMLVNYAVYGSIFPTCAVLMSGQFKILGHNIVNVVNTALLESKVPKDVVERFSREFNYNSVRSAYCFDSFREIRESQHLTAKEEMLINEAIKREEFDEIMCATFKRHIEHHQVILDFCMKLEDFLSPYLLIKLFLNRLYFCLEIICLMLVSYFNSKSIRLYYYHQFAGADLAFIIADGLYAFAALCELFLQTYCSQRVQDEVKLAPRFSSNCSGNVLGVGTQRQTL